MACGRPPAPGPRGALARQCSFGAQVVCLWVPALCARTPRPDHQAGRPHLHTAEGLAQQGPRQHLLHLSRQEQPVHPAPSKRILDGITRMKVETCVELRKEHDKDFSHFKKCLKLLREICNPGKDLVMDGDNRETPSGEGFCVTYFQKHMKEKAKRMAEECVKAAEQEGHESETYKSCLPTMQELCNPGSDMLMDGDKKEQSTGHGFCERFFSVEKKEKEKEKLKEKEKETETETEKEKEKEKEGGGEGDQHGDGEGSAAALEAEKRQGNATGGGQGDGHGDSRGGAGGSQGGAQGGGAGTGTSGKGEGRGSSRSKGAGKGGDRGAGRGKDGDGTMAGGGSWHDMQDIRGLPAQGYEGPPVTHSDMETRTNDWRREYGPNHPRYEEVEAICRNNPGNKWCKVHFPPYVSHQKPPPSKSGVASKAVALAAVFPLAVLVANFL